MTLLDTQPEAMHVPPDDCPFVDLGGGNYFKVLQVNEREGLWVVENIFAGGFEIPTHRHTGPVFAHTFAGSWKYKEYDYVNRAGSYLYEPAGSVHTLTSLEDGTHARFQIYGANIDLAPDGSVLSVLDGRQTLDAYYALCEAAGLPRPNVLVA